MNILIKRADLYQPLQKMINVISNKPRLPILSYMLLEIDKDYLFITVTNLEVEITTQILLDKNYDSACIMIAGRKFFEICKNLSKNSIISIALKNNKIFINSERSNFLLSTISTADFPKPKKYKNKFNISIPQSILKKMIKLTHFAMGNQDTRYYLNGMFFETLTNSIRMVATDGYRLAMCEVIVENSVLKSESAIIPRKSILELLNLLHLDEDIVKIDIQDHDICMQFSNYVFSSQLIEAQFPNYRSVFPKEQKIIFEINRTILKQALKRASILAHIKHRIVHLDLTINQLKITTDNFDQDTSEEILEISYVNENIRISFNIDYLLDVINVIDTQNLKFYILNTVSGIQIEGIPKCFGATYIIMPIKI